MDKTIEDAVALFSSGFSCSQAVLSSRCEEYGLSKELAYKVSGSFGGGMAHIGETCGAVTGAFMLIGLKYGKTRAEDTGAKDRNYAAVKEYVKRFKEKHGSISCKGLLGYDISNEAELTKARDAGVFKDICPMLVADSIEIVEGILK